ncbi:MAG TPA: DUF554 domain-containing protein [Bacteroidia bacterium]|nr:DUF554 domain-containing protein [Bacteroidia bacterium]HRS59732.1 DUF554 domain-containing protein [Bacteroidia bacterium]HRU68172.1 DUF554 domain-containing protein [Bacteroidia bacterium]
MVGTIVNVAAVVAGSFFGMILKKRLPEKFINVSFQVIGIFTLVLGFLMGSKSHNLLIQIISLLSGAWIGEWIDFDKLIGKTEGWVRNKFRTDSSEFFQGLIMAFLLFCAGSMTILGAVEEGINHNPHLLFVKSIMDGISAIALTIAFGAGVIFSVIPLFLYQAGLTLFAANLSAYFENTIITELSATGGFILVALGISILDLKKLKVINLIPSLVIVVIVTWLFGLFNF